MLMYERQRRETVKTYEAFKKYLQLGSQRKLESLKQELNIPIRTLLRWSKKWDWEKRATDFDIIRSEQNFQNTFNNPTTNKAFTEKSLLNLCSTIQDLINRINGKLEEGSEQFDNLSIENLLKHIQNLLKLFNELMKAVKGGNYFQEKSKDEFKFNLFEKHQDDEEFLKLTDEILLKLAGD